MMIASNTYRGIDPDALNKEYEVIHTLPIYVRRPAISKLAKELGIHLTSAQDGYESWKLQKKKRDRLAAQGGIVS